METPWDWITVLMFAGLITLFLHRSSQPEPKDELWHYAPPALLCAVANYVGNNGYPIVAAALLAAGGVYVMRVLMVQFRSK